MVARLFLVALLLSGCTTSRAGICAISKPIRLSDKAVDALSDAEVAAILRHNSLGEKTCRWKP